MCNIHCKLPEHNTKSRIVKNIALLIGICIIMTSFLSAAFILTCSNHEHDHEGPDGTCATCVHLAFAENLLKQFSTAIITNAVPLVVCLFISFCLKASVLYSGPFTLVSLKVRLDN